MRYRDPETGKTLVFLTNNFALPARTIAELYAAAGRSSCSSSGSSSTCASKRFFGTSENAVKTQIWIAVSVYVLIAIVKKRLDLEPSLYHNPTDLSVTAFEKMPLDQLLSQTAMQSRYTQR